MTTSGTYGAVPVTVATLIESAVRKTGKLPSTVSGELLLGARNSLYFLLLGLANRGLNLFCQTKQVLATVPGQTVYALQAGTAEVLRVNSRISTVAQGEAIAGADWVGADLGDVLVVGSMSVDFSVDVPTEALSVEYSNDQVVWTACATPSFAGPKGTLFYQDTDRGAAARYWRLRSLDGTLPQVADLGWHTTMTELPMTPMNRDEYQQLPNKMTVGSRPLQFWLDKQITPLINIWPLAPDSLQQIVVWMQRHIQDPGALSGQLAVPARWYEAIIYALALRIAEELPKGELDPMKLEWLKARSDEERSLADVGETDGAPIKLMPNLRRYNR